MKNYDCTSNIHAYPALFGKRVLFNKKTRVLHPLGENKRMGLEQIVNNVSVSVI